MSGQANPIATLNSSAVSVPKDCARPYKADGTPIPLAAPATEAISTKPIAVEG
jgi:hypothetical protein